MVEIKINSNSKESENHKVKVKKESAKALNNLFKKSTTSIHDKNLNKISSVLKGLTPVINKSSKANDFKNNTEHKDKEEKISEIREFNPPS